MQNLAQSNLFTVSFSKIPNLLINTQQVVLPGLTLSNPKVATPFANIPLPATKPEFSPLRFSFKASDNMEEYKAIMNWMMQIALVENFENRKGIKPDSLYGDVIVTKYDAFAKPVLSSKFVNVLPVSIGDLEYDTTNTVPVYLDISIVLEYEYFTID